MSLRDNINKLHIDLLNNFNDVSILEKSSLELGNYFELTINESSKSVRAILSKVEMENKVFNWKYYSNPSDDNSVLVERNSNIDNFTDTIKDIFEKNRFDSEYLKSLNN